MVSSLLDIFQKHLKFWARKRGKLLCFPGAPVKINRVDIDMTVSDRPPTTFQGEVETRQGYGVSLEPKEETAQNRRQVI